MKGIDRGGWLHAIEVSPKVMQYPSKIIGFAETYYVQFVRAFGQRQKPIAAICHGPWTLIEAELVRGKKMTSFPSIKTDLKNAGADWVDQEVVVDQGLITSRNPDDIPAFNETIIKEFAKQR